MNTTPQPFGAILAFLFVSELFSASAQIPTKMWDVRFGGSKYDIPDGIIETPDNGFILVGVSASNNDGNKSQVGQGYYDFWIIRTDAYGNKMWDRRFGGSDDDGAYDIQQTADGNYLVSGYSSSAANEDKSESGNGNKDFWVMKISPSEIKSGTTVTVAAKVKCCAAHSPQAMVDFYWRVIPSQESAVIKRSQQGT